MPILFITKPKPREPRDIGYNEEIFGSREAQNSTASIIKAKCKKVRQNNHILVAYGPLLCTHCEKRHSAETEKPPGKGHILLQVNKKAGLFAERTTIRLSAAKDTDGEKDRTGANLLLLQVSARPFHCPCRLLR